MPDGESSSSSPRPGRGGRRCTVLEIVVGRVDIGADLGWVSQYPDEREVPPPAAAAAGTCMDGGGQRRLHGIRVAAGATGGFILRRP